MLMYASHRAILSQVGSGRHKLARMNQSLGIEKVCKTLTTYGFDCWLAWVEPVRVRTPKIGGLQPPQNRDQFRLVFVGFPIFIPSLLADA